jgi:hypothetical protein
MKKTVFLALLGLSAVMRAADGSQMVPANAALAKPAAAVMVPANAAVVTAVPAALSTSSSVQSVAPLSATAAPLASTITAAPLAASGTAATDLSPTAVVETPTPLPTPTPFVEMPGRAKGVQLMDPSWALAVKLGGVLPLGDLAQYNQSGAAVGLDAYYHANADYSVDIFTNYSSQAYKLGGGQPLTNVGLGAKLLYNLANIDGITWYAGGGLAAYYTQRTRQVLQVPVLNNTPLYDPSNESTFGFGVLATLGGRYEFPSGWGLLLELNFATVNLAGGTSDNLLLAEPLLGLSYKI